MIGLLAWLAAIGVDFFLHGGLFAKLYLAENDPFLLSARLMFARIPAGYGAFALLTAMMIWLMRGQRITGAWAGALFGATLGLFVWGAFALGLYSVSTARISLLAAWLCGELMQMGVSGAVIGAELRGQSLWKLSAFVLGLIIIALAATIGMQVAGLAPPMQMVE